MNRIIVAALAILCHACAPSTTNNTVEVSSWPLGAELKCGGTEPFWSFLLKPGSGYYMSMEGDTHSYALDARVAVEGGNKTLVLQGFDTTSSQPVRIALRKTGQCSDGMSDFVYDYEIDLVHASNIMLKGCCGRQG
jgi:uncharacterized membrane protein